MLPDEIKVLFNNQLDHTRVTQLRRQFLAAGLPM
ncbi:MAG: phosphoribulokinase [Moraxellaceae bacterium]|nr:phosphoribulokinase [Moraxellaceae bacterium]